MKLYTSNQYQNAENTYYPNAVEITDAETLRLSVGLDHVAAQYQNNRRKNDNFIVSDCLMMDVDNAPAKGAPDIPSEEWVDLDKIAADLPGVEFYAATSRSHMKEKDGRPARPKYHIYFPITPVTDATMYRSLKVGLQRFYPYFDRNAADSARFFYGNRDAQITHIPGTRTVADYIIARTLSEPVKPTRETTSPGVSTTPRSTPSSVTTTSVDNGLYNLREVLDAINPSSLDYSDWVSVGMVLHKYQGAPYYFTVDDWDAWSRHDVKRYKENDCYKRWNHFDDNGRIGAATLIKIAKDHGWTPPVRVNKQRETVPPPEPPAYMVKDQLLAWDGEIEADEPETRSSFVELSSVRDDTHVEGNEQPSATPAEIPTEIHAPDFVSAADYINSGAYDATMAYFQKYQDRKTGFEHLDQYLTLYPGLAALGGASSLGKSTFCVNLADQLVKQGETVLYIALEQLSIELITKSISRIVKENDPRTPITNEHIKNGARTPDIIAARKQYAQEIGGRCYYVNGDFRMTALQIVEKVEKFIKQHDGVKPVCIIDYLQLIAPPNGGERVFRGGIREAIDENLKTLKDMQKRNELFVIVVSSFNRSSNMEPLSYESFKETGMIEFTCDYVWGLQLAIMDAENTSFYSTVDEKKKTPRQTTIDERRKMVNYAQSKEVREVEFISLKNRNGKQFFKVFFDYRPANDQYIERDYQGKPNDAPIAFDGTIGEYAIEE